MRNRSAASRNIVQWLLLRQKTSSVTYSDPPNQARYAYGAANARIVDFDIGDLLSCLRLVNGFLDTLLVSQIRVT